MLKTLIIGGVAGGATTAARLRRRDEEREIVILERGEYISYANCGLPYYIGDVIKSRDTLLLQTPEAMKAKFNIDVRTQHEVIKINRQNKNVVVRDLKNGTEYIEEYDSLVIATGSSPIQPPIPGIHNENIVSLWNVKDTDFIKNYIQEHKPEKVTVVGGGFIGLEMAENLHTLGMKVSLVELQNQVMAPIDFEMAQLLHENITMNNVDLYLSHGVKEFIQKDKQTIVCLNDGQQIISDLVILALGVKPNSSLAKEADLNINERGGIIVDEYLRTSDKDIYAVGDVIEVDNFVLKNKTMIPLAGPANKQGMICADNLVGDCKIYQGSLGSSVAKVFDLTVANVGVNEKMLQALGKKKDKDYLTIIINQKSHAGYYPGATPLTLKLIFDFDGQIYGGQIIGQDGVDKRIDTLATVMRLKGTIHDLAELELSYAPPYSSAKDPVNMLGFVAENVLDNLVKFIYPHEFDQLVQNHPNDHIVLDITEDVERMVYHIKDSYHIPLGQLHERINELDRNKTIIPYCAIGVRSYNAARILMQNGFSKVKVLAGGTAFYKSMHYLENNLSVQQQKQEIIPEDKELRILDCTGLQCPGPIMKVNEVMATLEANEVLKVSATDMGFIRDIGTWCQRTGHTLLKSERKGKENFAYIKKDINECPIHQAVEIPQGKTMVVFSGDLDKVLASFIIANGAAAMGRPVTMFFTFWGLNALRKTEKQHIKKSFIEKMFGIMMPRGSEKLKLSKMNMAGMGTSMMKKVMKNKNVNSLEELMSLAQSNGVKLVACTMSMDIMGITKEELIDGVELAGVASYLGDAEESNVNLFI